MLAPLKKWLARARVEAERRVGNHCHCPVSDGSLDSGEDKGDGKLDRFENMF